MGELTRSSTIGASRSQVWDLISIQTNWSIWSPARRVTLDPEGSPEPDGLGAVRLMHAGPVTAREEIIVYDAPAHMAYRLLGSFPARDYVSHIRLIEAEASTELTWSAEWADRPGPLGPATDWVMGRTIARMLAGIKSEAERRAAADG
jgi:hypothetical protein